jgi:cellulose biosynthesis protein BcsQ
LTTIAVFNIKGGVGKTATAVNLAWLAWNRGARVLLWDLDPQGAATWYYRIGARVKGGGKALVKGKRGLAQAVRGTDYRGLDLVPADFSYRKLDLHLASHKRGEKRLAKVLSPMTEEYDLVILDCAPSISLLSEAIFRAADALLVPTIPTPLSLRTLEQLEGHLHKRGLDRIELLPFLCMVDRRKRLHRELCDAEQGAGRFLEALIPYSSIVEQMGLHRAPVFEYAPRSAAAAAYELLWHEVEGRLALDG